MARTRSATSFAFTLLSPALIYILIIVAYAVHSLDQANGHIRSVKDFYGS